MDIRKKFITVRVLTHWDRLPRQVVVDPSLTMFQTKLDEALSSLTFSSGKAPLHGGALGKR